MPDDTTYDAFLSHSHQDAEVVEALAKRLEVANVLDRAALRDRLLRAPVAREGE